MCWILVKPYLEKSMDDFLNGSKGGRPRKNQNPGLSENENPGFEITETPVSFSPKTKKKIKKEDKEERQQLSIAPSAAIAPHEGALGGKTVLDSALNAEDRDAATEAARQKFLNSIKMSTEQSPISESAKAGTPSTP